MKPVELTLSVEINASQQEVFNKVVDWESQGEWMLGTKVKGTKNNGFPALVITKFRSQNGPHFISNWVIK